MVKNKTTDTNFCPGIDDFILGIKELLLWMMIQVLFVHKVWMVAMVTTVTVAVSLEVPSVLVHMTTRCKIDFFIRAVNYTC